MANFLSDNNINEMMTYAKQTQSAFLWMSQSAIDHVLTAVLDELSGLCGDLARSCAAETRMGIYEDKLNFLNQTTADLRTQYLSAHFQHTAHFSEMDTRFQRHPAGPVIGIIDGIQPIAEIFCCCIAAIKTGNPVILSFHPTAYGCSYAAATAIRDLAVGAGAPDNCIQWLEEGMPEMPETLLGHPDTAAVLASGHTHDIERYFSIFDGPGAFTCPTGSFCYIHQSADIERAVRQLIFSRTFDNGLSNCSEQFVWVDQPIYTAVKSLMQNEGCYMASPEEITRLTTALIDLSSNTANPAVMGQTPQTIAAMADISVPEDTRLIVMELRPDTGEHPLLVPFLAPAILLMPSEGPEQLTEDIKQLAAPSDKISSVLSLENTFILPPNLCLTIHAENENIIRTVSRSLPDAALIVNAPAASLSLSSQYTNRYGSHMNADTIQQLLTQYRCLHGKPDKPQTFRLPAVLHFQKGALKQLQFTDEQRQIAFLYGSDGSMQRDIAVIIKEIKNLHPFVKYHEIPVPQDTPVARASDYLMPQMKKCSPDCLIAIGSARMMDTARILIRDYRQMTSNRSPDLILIPSIDGCQQAMQTFDQSLTVIADSSLHTIPETNAFYCQCFAAMANAFDSYLSNASDDMTDALSMQAINLYLTWLPALFDENPKHAACLEHLQNACLLSGIAHTHTGMGLSEIMANRLHEHFRLPTATVQALLLPHVLEYNGAAHPARPSLHPSASGYTATEKLNRLCEMTSCTKQSTTNNTSEDPGLFTTNDDISIKISKSIRSLQKKAGIPQTIRACGIREKDYMLQTDNMATGTFEQLSTKHGADNPRYPLIKELTQLYKQIYDS